ncbi:quinone-dependent dihydroorotate dehydrogenase [Piscirickettsia litoralis]|uniref:Dihydroorotate dehydrogenase (quinone) n=1 Tax=Piscirickettsia litoralis TaxID=1891921 RepID=A0ABX3A4Y7_9GAMM|nr:quinone-dependent dihydroorotate dehydrogenase [Piscirickettsia litoralis]ODN43488.1 dihydroorotate dehydrogenase (quinone) [Piscirickettsia litoralis]
MSIYSLLRPLLFSLPAETAHHLSLSSAKWLNNLGLFADVKIRQQPYRVMGLDFPNPVGLAAGLDKNAEYIDALAKMGFGFLEVGTVTPKAQIGNPKPRLFRVKEYQAVINRMGFNNKGVDYLVNQVKQAKYNGILGINIGKNKDTPLEKAHEDYCFCMRKVYPYASYITVNISSPNTPELRKLQDREFLAELLERIKDEQAVLAAKYKRLAPVVLKLDSDMDDQALLEIAELVCEFQFDGVIISNTTVSRDEIIGSPLAKEAGGVSGAPLLSRSTEVLKRFHHITKGKVPLIGVGGIMDAEGALAKKEAGASLIQLYSGLVYKGPELVKEAAAAWHY